MRFYSFSNMYLSSLQVGLQSAHVVARMFIKYDATANFEIDSESKAAILNNWAVNYETMILLNGGYSSAIHDLITFFNDPLNDYPWAPFYESDAALDGALTSIGIILPEKIYAMSKFFREFSSDRYIVERQINEAGKITSLSDENEMWEFNPWEFRLIQKLNDYSLAR